MPVRLRVRLTTKIRSKNSLYPHRHFTEHLVGAFRKSPWESDLNHETSSFLIRQLNNYTRASPARIFTTLKQKQIERGTTTSSCARPKSHGKQGCWLCWSSSRKHHEQIHRISKNWMQAGLNNFLTHTRLDPRQECSRLHLKPARRCGGTSSNTPR
jgi:hypothetical protein